MKPTITIEIPADSEAFVRQLLALHEELNALALSAPDGAVLEACETAVVQKGRDLNKRILEDAVARRIETAEKGGSDPRLRLRPPQGEPQHRHASVRDDARGALAPASLLAVPVRGGRRLRGRRRPRPERPVQPRGAKASVSTMMPWVVSSFTSLVSSNFSIAGDSGFRRGPVPLNGIVSPSGPVTL